MVLNNARKEPGWKRQNELATQMKIPHLLYKEIHHDKNEKIKEMGPGKYDIKDFIEISKEKPVSSLNWMDVRTKRFNTAQSLIPGPGVYNQEKPGKVMIALNKCITKFQQNIKNTFLAYFAVTIILKKLN
jgi:hypothetical protein